MHSGSGNRRKLHCNYFSIIRRNYTKDDFLMDACVPDPQRCRRRPPGRATGEITGSSPEMAFDLQGPGAGNEKKNAGAPFGADYYMTIGP